MKKLLFILPALPDYLPYVSNYLSIADECSAEYDIVCWNRKGEDVVLPKNYIIYQHPTRDNYSPVKKLLEVYSFYRFTRRKIREKQYSLIFTYTIADSILFEPYLRRKYKGKYVFDIRDYSPLIDNAFAIRIIKRLLCNSAINVISSSGFKRWLPDQFDYVVCHNISLNSPKLSSIDSDYGKNECKEVLTIGSIRSASANKKVIDSLANRQGIQLVFVGDGHAIPDFKKHCESMHVENIRFYGRYNKEDEDKFVRRCDIMNIVLPHDINSATLMTNRLYLSARLRKPMIVSSGSFQAEIVNKYGLGLVIDKTESLYDDIELYWKSIDWKAFETNCDCFLKEVYDDMSSFKKEVSQLMLKWGH